MVNCFNTKCSHSGSCEICTQTRLLKQRALHVNTHLHLCPYTLTHKHTHTYPHTRIRTHAHTLACIFTHACTYKFTVTYAH